MHAPPAPTAFVQEPVRAALAAGGYVDDAADALASGNVYVSSEVSGADELAGQLEQQIGDASIGVAVFSDNAALEASGPEIVSELAAQTGYDTIIVAVGDDLTAGSHVLEPGEATRIANEAEGSTDSVDAALTATIPTCRTWFIDDAPRPTAGADYPPPPAILRNPRTASPLAIATVTLASVPIRYRSLKSRWSRSLKRAIDLAAITKPSAPH